MVQVAPDTPVVGSAKVKSRDPFGYWVGACASVAQSQDLAASGAGVGFMFENSQCWVKSTPCMNKRTKRRNQGIKSDFQAAVAAEEEATIGRWAWPSPSVPLEPGASSFVLENVIARMLRDET